MYGIDIETTALDPADGKLSLMQVFDPKTKRVWVYDAINGLPTDQAPARQALHIQRQVEV